jgi:hypothetical protein
MSEKPIRVYAGNAAVYCDVLDGKVVRVHLIAPPDDHDLRLMEARPGVDLLDPRNGDELRALDIVANDVWDPLLLLPDSVEWES